jgi:ribulose-phosphate 3-epimerase
MVKIAPSLLSADFANLEKEIHAITEAGADILHLDVMDGHFVPNLTFGLPIIKRISEIATIPLDVHLMVTNPVQYFEPLAKWKVKYISFHQETEYHIHRQLDSLRKLGVKAGIALNPATPVESIFPVLQDIDFVLVMSVNPGFGGQKFLPLVFNKIAKLRQKAKEIDHSLEIEVDGGVCNENATLLREAGMNILVAGSYIFNSDDYRKRINSLR